MVARVCTPHPAEMRSSVKAVWKGGEQKRGKEGNQYKAVLKAKEGHCHVALVTALEPCSSRSILGKWVPHS